MLALDHPTEFDFTEADFQWLRERASAHSGIVIADLKRNMIYSRLTKRLRALQLSSFAEYREVLELNRGNEFGEFINAITTNLTSFFREPHHYEHLTSQAIPQVRAKAGLSRPLRMWSAGCSTGEEPYSISIAVAEALSLMHGAALTRSLHLLATDLDTRVLSHAAEGIYEIERVERMGRARLRRWFQRGSGPLSGRARVKDVLRRVPCFEQLNLIQPWEVDEPYDVVFCRNVVIYFDKPTQRKLFERFAAAIAPGGFLYIGHSESLNGISSDFEVAGKTVYRRKQY